MFADRRDAGRRLAERLRAEGVRPAVVAAMARGGVPVAFEIAAGLGARLDVIVVRKLPCPWQPELGIGAVAEGGATVVNEDLVAELGLPGGRVDEIVGVETRELERRATTYRAGRPPVDVTGRSVVLVDDGLATGFTARAAVASLRSRGAASVVLAVPVGPERTVLELADVADRVVALSAEPWFFAVGDSYRDFRQVNDDEVVALLAAADAALVSDPRGPDCGSGTNRPSRPRSRGSGAAVRADDDRRAERPQGPNGSERIDPTGRERP